jgi:hypothetical protein
MDRIIRKLIYFLAFIVFSLAVSASSVIADRTYVKLGTKNWIDPGNYFVCSFSKPPKIGVAILVVKIFKKNGARIREFTVSGAYGMPEMRAHDSDETMFKQNKAGDYLLPVDIVMPGEWEVTFDIKNSAGTVYQEAIRFDVK